ncbi:unnamed protein product [Brachionus calyciflorus]|uniref:Solute carrier family 66 member 2 n=1 Tax=Brachionus calyciflorus TaxID=104777 RepID=A0A813XKP7_9BILA|nr:unnamed protein product [Brachionus calyciflorus]
MNIKANYDGLNDHLLNEKNDLNETYSVYTQISSFIGIIASGFMIFGGVVPYIPQYQMINRTRNASGFSTLVCLALLVANILRIFFWFGHPFEMPLLVQSVIMILCMLIMLELCIRVKAEMLHSSSMLAPPVKRFLDFETDYFWKWTDFGSYLQFLATFSLLIGTLTSLFINSTVFIEFLGFMSVFTEAMLAAPQFYRNYVTKSTEGMSITMVLMWTSGDLFKTTYFILRQSPLQFWLCGILQVSLDLAVLSQAYLYSQNPNKNLK